MRFGSSAILLLLGAVAVLSFTLGGVLGMRRSADQGARLDALSAEVALMARDGGSGVTGTSGVTLAGPEARETLLEEIKKQLTHEMGLMPISLLRERRDSFVELYAKDNHGHTNYGTAGYLGGGYFITVKHAVVALGGSEGRRIEGIDLMVNGRAVPAAMVDSGSARSEVDPGDWAILKVRQTVDIPALSVNIGYGFQFASPIFRLGNDYSKGIILASGYVGQRLPNSLVTCLTDGHPGVSGGGVLNQDGELVGIPVGRMQGDYRFSFILPVRSEMFRKVPGLARAQTQTQPQALAAVLHPLVVR
ncbi:MAG: serine protease [Acidobacteriota bacterium]|nr:serine protease [Acidobacteriota bacterium]